jgi:UDP-3-O-[3-hydroxymyristoyl] glucosamine N-acyltransferase
LLIETLNRRIGSEPSSMMNLGEIISRLGGELQGDPGISVFRVATLEKAGIGEVAFLANPRYEAQLRSTKASAVVIDREMFVPDGIAAIRSENPYLYFARLSALLNPVIPADAGVHASAVIHQSAVLSEGVSAGAHAVVEADARIGRDSALHHNVVVGRGAVIGEGCVLHSGVIVYPSCVIGDRVTLHAGVVVGADGFGIAWSADHWEKVPQVGRVCIGDDVEVGANTTIDRGAIEDTVIERGVKLDNLIQIAHNVHIGEHTAIAACVGIAGSTRIGRRCRIGGASGIAGHLTIADDVEISAHTLITKSIAQSGTYTGAYPFEPNRDWRKNAANLRNLSDLAQRIRHLEALLMKKEA